MVRNVTKSPVCKEWEIVSGISTLQCTLRQNECEFWHYLIKIEVEMSIFRYLLSHGRSDYGHDNYYRSGQNHEQNVQPTIATEKLRCSDCLPPNDAQARFCICCGKSLTVQCCRCQQPMLPTAALCEKCGLPAQTSKSSSE